MFLTIGVDTKSGGRGVSVNLGKMVNGKRFLLKNCLVLVGFGVSIRGGQFPLNGAPVMVFGQLFLGKLFVDIAFRSFPLDDTNC